MKITTWITDSGATGTYDVTIVISEKELVRLRELQQLVTNNHDIHHIRASTRALPEDVIVDSFGDILKVQAAYIDIWCDGFEYVVMLGSNCVEYESPRINL